MLQRNHFSSRIKLDLNDNSLHHFISQPVAGLTRRSCAGRDVNNMVCVHWSVESQHSEQDYLELVILPAVDDDVGAGVEDQEEM